MLHGLIKRATAKAKTVSGPKGLGLSRAIKKWSRIAEELEDHMMKCPSSTATSRSQSFNALARKRRMDISLTVNDIQQRQRRRRLNTTNSPSSSSTSLSQKNNLHALDSAIMALMRRHSMGVAIDETILDQLFCMSPSNNQKEDDSLSFFEQIGSSLIRHPLAIDAFMHALFVPDGRIKSIGIKTKCAKLVAMVVIASEKKLIETLPDEDKSEDWAQKLQNQTSEDVTTIANVSRQFFFFLICFILLLICTNNCIV